MSKSTILEKTQEAYEKQRAYFKRPEARKASDGSACTYLTPEGDKCGVGCLIPDDQYVPAMDDPNGPGGSLTRLLSEGTPVSPALLGIDLEWLMGTQRIHDGAIAGPDFGRQVVAGLDRFAAEFGLRVVKDPMTDQEIYEAQIAHFSAKETKFGFDNEDVKCLYRGPGGSKCAVGCLIPDEMYKTGFEDKPGPEVLHELNLLADDDNQRRSDGYIQKSQRLHDSFARAYNTDPHDQSERTWLDFLVTALHGLAAQKGLRVVA